MNNISFGCKNNIIINYKLLYYLFGFIAVSADVD